MKFFIILCFLSFVTSILCQEFWGHEFFENWQKEQKEEEKSEQLENNPDEFILYEENLYPETETENPLDTQDYENVDNENNSYNKNNKGGHAKKAKNKENDAKKNEWEKFKKHNKLDFKDLTKDEKKFHVFVENDEKVKKHNSNSRNCWKMGANKFSHLTFDEFEAEFCGTKVPELRNDSFTVSVSGVIINRSTPAPTKQNNFNNAKLSNDLIQNSLSTSLELPAYINYLHLMQPVQDQGNCGACWSFAVLAQLEASLKALNPNFNTTLSRSYLVDCDFYDLGCLGGWPANALWWMKLSGRNRAPPTNTYPYIPPVSPNIRSTCRTFSDTSYIPINIASIYDIGPATENDLMYQVANFGPQVVAIYASPNLQLYQSGVLVDNSCYTGNCYVVNHAVVVVGYGTDPLYGDYWLIRNSWGPTWGENGYYRLARNRGNMCQVACWPQYATLG